ncbi:MAG: hypothetical protein S4CHLAM7_06330 [Chlamydiae bacterium]|nr:hypothetical protein [Chlamydiota bacterium]
MEEPIEYTSDITWQRVSIHYKKNRIEGMPKISVVVPCFNQSHVLKTTLESLLAQKNVDLEIIVIDAGSKDSTYPLLKSYKEKIARLYFVTDFDLTLMVNKGASLSTAPYVCFLLPGCIYLNPYSLCQIARTAYENNCPDFVYAANNHTGEGFKRYKHAFSNSLISIPSSFTVYPFTDTFLKRGFLPTSPYCMWFKVASLKKQGYLNHKYSFSKAIFDLLCRYQKNKDITVATTFWATSNVSLDTRNYFNILMLFDRFLLINKHYGVFQGLLWFFRDKPIHIFSWFLNSVRNIFTSR